MSSYDLVLRRLEAALAPDSVPPIAPVVMEMGRDKNGKPAPYWRSGYVTALSEQACRQQAEFGRASLGNVPPSLLRIPWC